MTATQLYRERPQAAYRPLVGTGMLASIFLCAALVAAMGFPTLWPAGIVPLWLLCVGIAGLVTVVLTPFRRRLKEMFAFIGPVPIAAWLVLTLLSAVVAAFDGSLLRILKPTVLFNLSSFGLLVLAATWASLARPMTVLLCIAAIALGEGVVALLQYSGQGWAWRLPQTLMAMVGTDAQDPYSINGRWFTFADLGRVRGTYQFVHKFNGVIGPVTAFLLAVMLSRSNPAARDGLDASGSRRLFLFVATSVAVVATFLTFSRSTFVGLGVCAFFIIVLEFRLRTIATAALGLAGAISIGILLRVTEARAFQRLFVFGGRSNFERIDQLRYAGATFEQAPLLGQAGGAQIADTLTLELIHSVPLRFLIDYGLAGLIPYLLLLFSLTRRFMTGIRWPGGRRIALAGLAAMAVLIIDSATHTAGLGRRDEAQAALVGALLGMLFNARPAGFEVRVRAGQAFRRSPRAPAPRRRSTAATRTGA